MTQMEKNKTAKKKPTAYKSNSIVSKVEEPYTAFYPVKVMPILKEFTYKEFKKIADTVPFTQQEWSDILHVSERTLQRYAKANSSFPFSVTDRVLQIDKIMKRGTEVFGNINKFINWIRSNPPALEGRISIHSLKTFDGINMILAQLVRIEHGVLA